MYCGLFEDQKYDLKNNFDFLFTISKSKEKEKLSK